MHELASFDRLIARSHPSLSPLNKPAARLLRDPEGQVVSTLASGPDLARRILFAAHRVAAGDWLGLLADENRARGLQQAWRLALLRAERHGQPRTLRDGGPLWLSPALPGRPGLAPALLRQQVEALALRQLWQQGWRW
ncbi:hypothetical protein [Paucibacter sp. M5-1]|uniref:hypothetical protein n=1 Tax=Paucibacter sp. M5-1 TaxID=3015998 RepID=UPI0022B8A44B|nr:hypothetical protein [Paucibacter sp. M5-1]MCZ7881054.1 hypothetical protein [Paucibacter sp. M5-1]